ncbi:MAG: PEP/pyruvate-binding domain-containing protein [Candidatus Brocadiia bacterium]
MNGFLVLLPTTLPQEKWTPILGGKGRGLQELASIGAPVPSTVVLKADAYRAHIALPIISATMPKKYPLPEPLTSEQAARIRAAIDSAPLPEEVESAIADVATLLPAQCYAVRSSSVDEDSPFASHAGQHDSFLKVAPTGLSEAVRHVYASLWSDRALAYRSAVSRGSREPAMAVVIQPMVAADAAGVLFTRDPINGDSQMLIEAVQGLGDALVSGRVTPARYAVDSADYRLLGTAVPVGGTAPLNEDDVSRLAWLGADMENRLGRPLDIEWALAGGEFFILQARPITATPAALPADRQIWTRINAAEVMPDVVTPATWSLVDRVVREMFTHFLRDLGFELGDNPVAGRQYGRVYLNLNTFTACAKRIPGLGEDGLADMFGGDPAAAKALARIHVPDGDLPELEGGKLGFYLRMPGSLLKFLFFGEKKGRAILARLKEKMDAEVSEPIDGLTTRELALKIADLGVNLRMDKETLDLLGLGRATDGMFYGACKRWFGAEGHSIASSLLAGLGGNDNARAGVELYRLAKMTVGDTDLRRAVLAARSFAEFAREWANLDSGKAFVRAFDIFLMKYGHHCRGELELMNPRWSETPDYVLSMIQSYVQGLPENDFIARYSKAGERRLVRERSAKAKLRNPFKRLVFVFLLRKAQKLAPMRESAKSELVRLAARLREIMIALGDRLVAEGKLSARDDVFFLTLEEGCQAAWGEMSVPAAQKLISGRRAEYEGFLEVSPPDFIVCGRVPGGEPTETGTGDGLLRGVAINPGVVTGVARVIMRESSERLRSGEILVMPFADPGWTPYFLNASAIVMEQGGILSHGSVVAREFGIPAVANVPGATTIIRSGQFLRVDGSAGTVEILPKGWYGG